MERYSFSSELGRVAAVVVLVLFMIIVSVQRGKYLPSYFLAFSEPSVDEKLWMDFGERLNSAGIVSISAPAFPFSESTDIAFQYDGERYEAEISMGALYTPPGAWIEIKKESLDYRSVSIDEINYEEFNKQYSRGAKLIEESLAAVDQARSNLEKWKK